jgi:hypothetical protein
MLCVNKTPLLANRSILQPGSLFRFGLVYLLYAAVLTSTCHGGDPYSTALDRFVRFRPEEYLAQLDRQRPPLLPPEFRAEVLAALPKQGEIKRLTALQQRKLDSLAPVLRAHGREGVYTLKVVEAPQAKLSLHARFVVLITETALGVLSSAELQGVVAHEIGHEYVWQEYESAKKRRDSRRLRELELICDGIAVVTLARIGADSSNVIAALRLLYSSDYARGIAIDESGYPSLVDRRNFTMDVQAWLIAGRATAAPTLRPLSLNLTMTTAR